MPSSRVHAKFILCGEHFVVHGGKCVLLPAECFSTRVTLNELPKPEKAPRVVCTFDGEIAVSSAETAEYQALVARLLRHMCVMFRMPDDFSKSLDCRVASSIPPGQGAGSSSALACALVDAFLEVTGKTDIGRQYRDFYSQQLENSFHGPVSGCDNIAVSRTCPVMYCVGEETLQFLPDRNIRPLYFVVGSTGRRTDGARRAFDHLNQLKKCEPTWLSNLVSQSNELCESIMLAMSQGQPQTIGECFTQSQALLEQIGASSHQIVEAVRASRQAGAFGAKLTGAGCGGFVIAVCPEMRINRIMNAWKKLGLSSIRSIVCATV